MEFILEYSLCVLVGPDITDTEMRPLDIMLVKAAYIEDAKAIGESLKGPVIEANPAQFSHTTSMEEAVDSLDCEVTPLETYLNRLRAAAKTLHESD